MLKNHNQICVETHICIKADVALEFAEWQARFHSQIASQPGFVSLEILCPHKSDWVLKQRFATHEDLQAWHDSPERRHLFEELKPLLDDQMVANPLKDLRPQDSPYEGGVSEVIITRAIPSKIADFKKWVAKIHQIEAKFPGFRGVYVQSPQDEAKGSWITILQFDNAHNLDHWLNSSEHKEALEAGAGLIERLESHRVFSSFAGWFVRGLTVLPPVWKQAMLVLLVLFPIVMLEIKFLYPLIKSLNPSLATFIGNALSVTLVSWPAIPIAIYFLGWWLNPHPDRLVRTNILGLLIIALLYMIEILALWELL